MSTLINGVPCDTISVHDRGLLYGDGVFRTFLLRNGNVLHWQKHYAKLQHDCSKIKLPCPPEALLHIELASLIRNTPDGVIKITVTRGESQRGYAPPPDASATRIVSLSSLPQYPETFSQLGVRTHLCQIRLSQQPALAGVKHLNRLENVLAAAEWNDPDMAEGLLQDESGFVIEGVRSNIFMVKDGNLITPDLSRCGVAGVQRERIIDWARQVGMSCQIMNITLQDLLKADEIFLVNSVIGLWPVREMPGYQCNHHPVARMIQNWMHQA